jgi:hypothetical protein
MKQATYLIESIFSIAVFAVITLAIAGTTYQVFNPDSGLILWISKAWNTNPALLALLGGIGWLVKRWLSGVQGIQVADLLFYGTVMLGLYFGYTLLIAT